MKRKDEREDGHYSITIDQHCKLFKNLEETETVLLTHGDSVDKVAPMFKVVAPSGNIIAAITSEENKLFGVQFYPEVDLTEHGLEMFRSFLF